MSCACKEIIVNQATMLVEWIKRTERLQKELELANIEIAKLNEFIEKGKY